MKCPICGLWNPEIAERCDCGHHFFKDKLKKQKLYANAPTSQDSRVTLAKTCLHIAAGTYFLCWLLLPVLFTKVMEGRDFFIVWFVFILLVVLHELAVYGLNKKKLWAWVLSICLFTVYIPTPLMLLGGIGIWALQSKSTRMELGIFN